MECTFKRRFYRYVSDYILCDITKCFLFIQATLFVMDSESSRILHMENGDSREVDRNSTKLEGVLFERAICASLAKGLKITEVISDTSSSFIKIMGK